MKINLFKSQLVWLFIICTMGTLSSCGGGGSSNTVAITTPETTWIPQTVVINGQNLKYTFGSGNPTQVALPSSSYLATYAADGIDYVTPLVEEKLKSFLDNPFLSVFISKCPSKIKASFNPSNELEDFNISTLNINNLLKIDAKTGRKEINGLIEINDILNSAIGYHDVGWANSCLQESEMVELRKLKTQLSDISKIYINSVVLR